MMSSIDKGDSGDYGIHIMINMVQDGGVKLITDMVVVSFII